MSTTTIAAYTNEAIKGLQEPFRLAVQYNLEQYREQEFINFGSSSEYDKIYSSLEGLTGFRKLGEEEVPDAVSLNQGYNTTISADRGGIAMVVSQTTMVRAKDDTTKIDRYLTEQRDQLLKTAVHGLLTDAFAPFNEAFDTTSPSYPAPDGISLCGTHTYNGGGTFTNAVASVFSESAMDTADEYAGSFKDQAGKPMPLNWTAIMVKKGSAAARAAKRLFANEITPTAVNDINVYEGTLRVIETPYINTAAYVFLIDSNIMASPVILDVVEYPTFQDPITLENQSIRSNITGYWRNGVACLPINIYGFKGSAL